MKNSSWLSLHLQIGSLKNIFFQRWKSGKRSSAKWLFLVRSRRQGCRQPEVSYKLAREASSYPDSSQVNEVDLTKRLLCVVESYADTRANWGSHNSFSRWINSSDRTSQCFMSLDGASDDHSFNGLFPDSLIEAIYKSGGDVRSTVFVPMGANSTEY